MKPSLRLMSLFMLLIVPLFAVPGVSQDVEVQPEPGVYLKVRCIRALGLLDESSLSQRENVIIDTRLRDLDRELHALPFQMYQLLDQKVFPVSTKRKQDIRLVNGQLLHVRLLSKDKDEMALWLRWQDRSGIVVLDTRLKMNYGHNILAGTESVNRSGAVLALEPVPSPD